MANDLNRQFSEKGTLPKTERSNYDLRLEVCIARMREYIVDQVNRGVAIIDLKTEDNTSLSDMPRLTFEMLNDEGFTELSSEGRSKFDCVMDFRSVTGNILKWQYMPPTDDLIRATFIAARLSALDELKKNCKPNIDNDSVALEGNEP